MGHMFLVLIDAHSKWLEVYQMSSATSSATIQRLRTTFAQFGIPDIIVTDNGTCFTSSEFAEFLRRNGVKHIKSAPYHPATNGLAERAMQVFKTGMRKMQEGTIPEKLARMLFQYRITPQTTTGMSPAELLMGRRLRLVSETVERIVGLGTETTLDWEGVLVSETVERIVRPRRRWIGRES